MRKIQRKTREKLEKYDKTAARLENQKSNFVWRAVTEPAAGEAATEAADMFMEMQRDEAKRHVPLLMEAKAETDDGEELHELNRRTWRALYSLVVSHPDVTAYNGHALEMMEAKRFQNNGESCSSWQLHEAMQTEPNQAKAHELLKSYVWGLQQLREVMVEKVKLLNGITLETAESMGIGKVIDEVGGEQVERELNFADVLAFKEGSDPHSLRVMLNAYCESKKERFLNAIGRLKAQYGFEAYTPANDAVFRGIIETESRVMPAYPLPPDAVRHAAVTMAEMGFVKGVEPFPLENYLSNKPPFRMHMEGAFEHVFRLNLGMLSTQEGMPDYGTVLCPSRYGPISENYNRLGFLRSVLRMAGHTLHYYSVDRQSAPLFFKAAESEGFRQAMANVLEAAAHDFRALHTVTRLDDDETLWLVYEQLDAAYEMVQRKRVMAALMELDMYSLGGSGLDEQYSRILMSYSGYDETAYMGWEALGPLWLDNLDMATSSGRVLSEGIGVGVAEQVMNAIALEARESVGAPTVISPGAAGIIRKNCYGNLHSSWPERIWPLIESTMEKVQTPWRVETIQGPEQEQTAEEPQMGKLLQFPRKK